MAFTKTLAGTGVGGGASLTVKDEGSTLTTAATSLDVVGNLLTATNVGSAVTLTSTGNPYYGPDDTPPGSPNVADDEFSTGSSIDTAGTRFSGATAWAWKNQGSSSTVITGGALFLMTSGADTNAQQSGVEQVLPSGAIEYEAKWLGGWNNGGGWGHMGMYVRDATNDLTLIWGIAGDGGHPLQVVKFSGNTWASVTPYNVNHTISSNAPVYLRIQRDGSNNLVFKASRTKRRWYTFLSVAQATYLTAAATRIGLTNIRSQNNTAMEAEWEYFRRVA